MSENLKIPDHAIAILRLFYSGRENLRHSISVAELSGLLKKPGRWRFYEGRPLDLPATDHEIKAAIDFLLVRGLILRCGGDYEASENFLEQIVAKRPVLVRCVGECRRNDGTRYPSD